MCSMPKNEDEEEIEKLNQKKNFIKLIYPPRRRRKIQNEIWNYQAQCTKKQNENQTWWFSTTSATTTESNGSLTFTFTNRQWLQKTIEKQKFKNSGIPKGIFFRQKKKRFTYIWNIITESAEIHFFFVWSTLKKITQNFEIRKKNIKTDWTNDRFNTKSISIMKRKKKINNNHIYA